MATADIWPRAIVEQNHRWLLAYFLASTGNRDHAEDLVQEVFTIVIQNETNFDATKSFGAWVRGIARNVLLQHYKQQKRAMLLLNAAALSHLDCAAEEAELSYATPGHAELRLEALRVCLDTLTSRVRAALELRYTKSKSSREIAGEFQMTSTAVDMLLCRARKALESCIEQKLRLQDHA